MGLLSASALLVALALLGNLLLRDHALELETPEARLARLAPHWRVVRPQGPSPAPVAILLSGCDGLGDNMDFWAEVLARMGWASLVLDSHRPRGLDQHQAWRLVCSGQTLSGAERSGDLAVVLAALNDMEGLDGGRVVLFGASHGAWTAMELIGRLGREAPPPGLTAWPEPRDVAAGRLLGSVLLYPYCGWFNRAGRWEPTSAAVPVLMVLAGADTIVSTAACETIARRLIRGEVPVRVRRLPGIDHAFDQRVHAAFSNLEFDPEATAMTVEFVSDFLATLPLASGRRPN